MIILNELWENNAIGLERSSAPELGKEPPLVNNTPRREHQHAGYMSLFDAAHQRVTRSLGRNDPARPSTDDDDVGATRTKVTSIGITDGV
jgi:hypothetical protein